MKRSSNAAKDLAALLADASPDVRAANAHAAEALTADVRAELHAAYRLVDARTGKPAGGAVPSEHDEQVALFAWADANVDRWPELALMFSIPNGAKVPYTRDAKGRMFSPERLALTQEGMRRGVPDVFLAALTREWGGLFIELKRRDHSNGPTPEQRDWLARLNAAGYKAVICYGADEAIKAIMDYLAQNGPEGA